MAARGKINSDNDDSAASAHFGAAGEPREHATDRISHLFDAHRHQIHRYLRARCGSADLAEEILSETFVAAMRLANLGRHDEISLRWLHTVARRRLIDHWRRKSVGEKYLALHGSLRVDQHPDEPELDDSVQEALSQLCSRQRSALVLKYLRDQTTRSVARSLNLSYSATESLLARARVSFSAHYVAC